MGNEINQAELDAVETAVVMQDGQYIEFDPSNLPAVAKQYMEGIEGPLDIEALSKVCHFASKIGEYAMENQLSITPVEVEQPPIKADVDVTERKIEPLEPNTKSQQVLHVKEAESAPLQDKVLEDALRLSVLREAFKPHEHVSDDLRVVSTLTEDRAPVRKLQTKPADASLQTNLREVIETTSILDSDTEATESTSVDVESQPTTIEKIQPMSVTATEVSIMQEDMATVLDQPLPIDATTQEAHPIASVEITEAKETLPVTEVIQTWLEETLLSMELPTIDEGAPEPQNETSLTNNVEAVDIFVAELMPLLLELGDDISTLDTNKLLRLEEVCIELFSRQEVILDALQAKVIVRRLLDALQENNAEAESMSIDLLNYLGTNEHRLSSGYSLQQQASGVERISGLTKYLFKRLNVQPVAV